MNTIQVSTENPAADIATYDFWVEWEPKSSICTNKLAFWGFSSINILKTLMKMLYFEPPENILAPFYRKSVL